MTYRGLESKPLFRTYRMEPTKDPRTMVLTDLVSVHEKLVADVAVRGAIIKAKNGSLTVNPSCKASCAVADRITRIHHSILKTSKGDDVASALAYLEALPDVD
jgi:hypothetical protein